MSDFPSFENMADVDAAHGTVNVRGERVYAVDPRFRAHVESERLRLLSGQPAAPVPEPNFDGVSGTDALGRRQFIGRAPDPKMVELCQALSARRGPDGRRLVDSEPGYRERVEASFADAAAGKAWSPAAEKMAADLADEAANQAADTGLYPGIEKQPDGSFDRTDPLFQDAARVASEAGLSDKQFAAVLNFYAKLGGQP